MISDRLKWLLLVVMILGQLYVTLKMTGSHEAVITEGQEFRFRVAPADPNDPLRGKFMRLAFADIEVPIDTLLNWNRNTPIAVILEEDKEGYAIPASIAEAVQDGIVNGKVPYCMATIRYINRAEQKAILEYPFDRLYMNERKAPIAEDIYNESIRDSLNQVYAIVSINEGSAVLQEVYINGISLSDLAAQQLSN